MENNRPNQQPGNPFQPERRTPGKFKFNFSWIYGLIIVILLGSLFLGDGGAMREVSYSKFEDLVKSGSVERVRVFTSRNTLEARITPEAAKELFGGLGANVFNPALSGRAFLFVSFPVAMSSWTAPFSGASGVSGADALSSASVDAVSNATPLSFLKPGEGLSSLSPAEVAARAGFDSAGEMYWTWFTGQRGGCIGESAIPVILVMGIVLLLFRVIDWRAPAAMLVSAVAVTWIAGVDPVLTLLSGGLLFGAVFMVTDYATAPQTSRGRLLFGAGCGVITALIRVFGGYPEGVMFSILIMNAVAPFLNRLTGRKYGWTPPAGKGKSAKGGAA